MSKYPAFLFYPNDYIGGTMGMTFEEKGAYMELLMMQFNRGHMTSHMVGQVVGQIWDKIKDKFEIDDQGRFYNKRLDEEIKKRQTFVKSRYNNLEGTNQYTKKVGKKAGHMRGHMTSHMENENENENINDNESENRGESAERGETKIKDFIDQVVDEFVTATGGEYIIISRGKERGAAGKLVNIFKRIFPDAGTKELLDQLRDYFARCVTIEDPWLRDNMSLSIIISKFNEINKILKNGRSKQGRGATLDEIIGAVSKYFPIEGYPGRG